MGMIYQLLFLAVVSPGRQLGLRKAVIAHLLILLGCLWAVRANPAGAGVLLGHVLLTVGIAEGAILIGWRLTQFPKNLGLEFLLVSPEPPWRFFTLEALVGMLRLGLVTISGLPLLILLMQTGHLEPGDVAVLLALPYVSGLVVGLGLTWWVYEPAGYRKLGERFVLLSVLLYLGVGVLAGEQLRNWLNLLPATLALLVFNGFEALHRYNAFSILQFWMEEPLTVAWPRLAGLFAVSTIALSFFLIRGACRLLGHFHELHYLPARNFNESQGRDMGEHPLSWWAVRRVSSYSGRVNLWLATGISVLYSAYLLAGSHWPSWLGRSVFELFDRSGGAPMLTTVLIVLAAVPAAFQYGLWDSNSQERCRKLELLLLTRVTGADFWRASAAAAWARGKGYFYAALLLWGATALAHPLQALSCLAALAAGVILWVLYFALGFRAFTRGSSGGNLGLLLTIGLPVLAYALYKQVGPPLTALVPPGAVFMAGSGGQMLYLALGALAATLLALIVARRAILQCKGSLAAWYEAHQGNAAVE
jgi:hypothetical protein